MKDSVGLSPSYVYMVKCEDESIYTGITKDIKKRMKDHAEKAGKGAKYTRSRTVLEVLMVWQAETYASAARLEYAIKRLTRDKKLQLIAEPVEGINKLMPQLCEECYISDHRYNGNIKDLLCKDD